MDLFKTVFFAIIAAFVAMGVFAAIIIGISTDASGAGVILALIAGVILPVLPYGRIFKGPSK